MQTAKNDFGDDLLLRILSAVDGMEDCFKETSFASNNIFDSFQNR